MSILNFASSRVLKLAFSRILKPIAFWGHGILGLACIIGGPLLFTGISWMIPTALALFITAILSALGGVLFSRMFLSWQMTNAPAQTQPQPDIDQHALDTAREHGRLEAENQHKDEALKKAEEDNLRLQLDKARLEAEKERLERMSIQIDSAAPILKLGLIEVKMSTSDFVRESLDFVETLEGIPPFRKKVEEEDEYVGLQQVTLRANLGIDLKQVKVAEYDGKLFVSGIKSESHGISHRETKWLQKEIRIKRFVDGKYESTRIANNDPRLTDLLLKQERGLDKRLNQGLEFAQHDDAIRRIAEGYIRLLLSPTGKDIEFPPPGNESGEQMPLESFIGRHNEIIMDTSSKLTKNIEQKERQLQIIDVTP
jgi:hypothetical protein